MQFYRKLLSIIVVVSSKTVAASSVSIGIFHSNRSICLKWRRIILHTLTSVPHSKTFVFFKSMKMPSNQSSENGLYAYEDTTYISESIENNGVEEFNASPEDDFSEYLWMENEEEFDKEVFQPFDDSLAAQHRRNIVSGDAKARRRGPYGRVHRSDAR